MALLKLSSCGKCTPEKLSIRQTWDDISNETRASYISAMKCMLTKPSRSDPTMVPGARNWIDDFTWVHINQTNYIHQSALPYWHWERWVNNQSQSPVWQPDSFGGNGEYVPHPSTNVSIIGLPEGSFGIFIPHQAGTGGGYITNGLFGNHYNLRRLKRDFTQSYSTSILTYKKIVDLWRTTSIHDFHPLLKNGAHLGGHSFIGGDGADTYSSPNEPDFFLHHAKIDRLWTVWRGLDYESRMWALDGTVTIENVPPSRNATLNTVMKMGVLAGGAPPIEYAMNAVGGDYC